MSKSSADTAVIPSWRRRGRIGWIEAGAVSPRHRRAGGASCSPRDAGTVTSPRSALAACWAAFPRHGTDSPGETTDETMTVSADAKHTPEPQPVDLFDGHPDPVLYFADEGHGPVVRAANESFGATFDVPSDRLAGQRIGSSARSLLRSGRRCSVSIGGP